MGKLLVHSRGACVFFALASPSLNLETKDFSPLCPTYSPVDSAFRGGEGASVRDATKFPPTEHEFPAPSREAAGQSQGRDSLLTEDHSGQRHL